MRRNRIIWFCLWILSLVGISFHGGIISYGFFIAVTITPVFSLFYLLLVYVLFHIWQNVERRYVSVNEPVKYKFSLVNECPLLFTGIRVRYFSDFSKVTDFSDEPQYELMPDSRIEKETTLICKYRGEYDIGIKEIEIEDYFRLFRIRYKNKECVHAVVKPQLVKTDKIGDIELSEAVSDSFSKKTEPDVLSREYVMGDDRRFINWSQSARLNTLMTREYTGESHNEIAVITDTFRNSENREEFIPTENKILETTLAISYYFSRNNIPASEYHYQQGLVRVPIEDSFHFDEFYENISAVSFDKRSGHILLLEEICGNGDVLRSSMAFFVLSSWNSDTEKIIRTFSENGVSTIICFITDDKKRLPDLSGYKGIRLIGISPSADLTEGIGL